MAGEILVALAASQDREHLAMVRSELMRVLSYLVTNIEEDLSKCEPGSADPSTMETRLLRLVRTLSEVFKEAARAADDQELKIEDFLREARLEDLWSSLDRTLDRLHDTEVFATPAQRILSTGVAPSQLRVESAGSNTSGTLASNVQTTPPKPLLNRLLPLIEAFFVLHNGFKEAELEQKEKDLQKAEQEGGSSSSDRLGKQVFADLVEVTLVERSRFGQFCKQHRRPLNALIKQTPSLLNKSFSPVLKHMPHCLDFDNKRAYFRSQLRSRRMESRYETIRLRVRRSEIFMDSYHQLRHRSGEEMRAKIQVQFQGEEGIDAGGVGKEWYGALAKEIFNPNYALFVQAGGKACTYHPNPMSYVTRDHLDFFHFIGRVIGKAIHDAQNLEAWFTRGFYKHMLGKKVIAADLEAFDPEYFSNLKWMLDNDITDIVELYFCAESDELGQMKA
ncbi:E3 ubiquitin-protein ligase UPL2 (Ubiquitin-protein ligase 2) (HECT-type E3 ubiquitin transferase UPL2) [Durusdinium trenchii]|uniref:HECT-type E3 ubiquitin transferase n=1 Tax=Durusdinium trenchii TaxID=1381693 RepID=A0ABP0LLY5_9DINO